MLKRCWHVVVGTVVGFLTSCAPLDNAALLKNCHAPTPDPRWNDLRDVPVNGVAGAMWETPEPPPLDSALDPASLRGTYLVAFATTAGLPANATNTVRFGRMVLEPNDTAHLDVRCAGNVPCGNRDIRFPLVGFMNDKFSLPGPMRGHSSYITRSHDSPGVFMVHDIKRHTVKLMLGAPFPAAVDGGGASAQLFRVDKQGFVARWVDVGREVAAGQSGKPTKTQGYFCARRVGK